MRSESENIKRLREIIEPLVVGETDSTKKISHFLLVGHWVEGSHIANPIAAIKYLTGCEAQGILLVSVDPPSSCLISDLRYTDQVKKKAQVSHYSTIVRGSMIKTLRDRNLIKPGELIAYDDTITSADQRYNFYQAFPDNNLVPLTGIIQELSSIKTEEELLRLKGAISLAEEVFLGHILPDIRQRISRGYKVSTIYLDEIIKSYGLYNGVENALSIILIGEHSYYMHGKTGDPNWKSQIEKGDIIVFNWGYVVDGQCSDITRAVIIGKPRSQNQKIFKEAYKLCVNIKKTVAESIKFDTKGKDLWKGAQGMVKATGKDYKFISIGHGIGIQIHNYPRFGPKSNDHIVPGQLLNLEPGIILPSIGCARVGGPILATKDGYQDLCSLPEDLVVI